MADKFHHKDKKNFEIPFFCGANNLGESLTRISEGASIIKIKGDAGTGNIVNAIEHSKNIFDDNSKL